MGGNGLNRIKIGSKHLHQNPALMCLLFIYSSVISVFALYLGNGISSFEVWVTFTAIIMANHLVLAFLTIRSKGYSITDFPSVFLLTTVLFNYSQILLLGIFKGYKWVSSWNKLTIYPEEIYKNTALILVVAVTCYVIGIRPFKYMSMNSEGIKECFTGSDLAIDKRCVIAGWIIIAFTLPFNLYEAYTLFMASRISYLATYETGIHDFVISIGWISVAGVACLITGYASNAKKLRLMALFFVIYGVEMISGNRGNSICAILALIVIYFADTKGQKKKINIIKLILIIALGYLLLDILLAIHLFRHTTDKSVTSFVACMIEANGNNPVFQTMENFGGTIAVISITQIFLKETHAFFFGKTFLAGLLAVFPNFSPNLQKLIRNSTLVAVIQEHGIYGRYTNIGSNYIAELYANFGYLWWIVMVLVGILVSILYEKLCKEDDAFKKACYSLPILCIITWTRWSFSQFVRLFFWGELLMLITYYIVGMFIHKNVR